MSLAPFIRTDSGFHPVVDRRELLAFYRDLPQELGNISSPSDVVAWEVLRERFDLSDRDAVPCDLFVWGKGAPPDPRLTRVGGTPWLPKSVPWPIIDGVVCSFLCQFNFCDSVDLVGDVPGDLLLTFVTGEDALIGGHSDQMRFVWVSANEIDVIGEGDVPKPTHPFEHVRAWGVRHRTADLPGCREQAYELSDEELWQLPVLEGTKIGGAPYNSQDDLEAAPADYLCQLLSIQASHNTMWPWANEERPLTLNSKEDGIYFDLNQLMIGDMGELTFYLRSDGSIGVDAACA